MAHLQHRACLKRLRHHIRCRSHLRRITSQRKLIYRLPIFRHAPPRKHNRRLLLRSSPLVERTVAVRRHLACYLSLIAVYLLFVIRRRSAHFCVSWSSPLSLPLHLPFEPLIARLVPHVIVV
jgi:hypothetical protein